MPNQKISELTTIVTVDNAVDLFPIVDTSANTTKKITPTALKSALALDNVNNTSDANKPVSTAQQDALNAKVTANAAIVAATKTKITYDAKGLVTAGDILDAADMPTGINAANIGTGVVSSTEFGYLDGVTSAIQTQIDAKQATLVSGTNIKTLNSISLLGSGDISLPGSAPSGVAGAIQFTDGSVFASDATKFFWDNTNKRLGVGTNSPSTTVDILPPVQTATATQFDCMRVGYSNSTIGITNGSALQVQVATTGSGRYSTTLRLSGSSDTSQAYLKAFAANNFGVMLNRANSNLGLFSDNGIKLGDTAFAGAEGVASGMVHIKGSGSTSATTSLLVQNSLGDTSLKVNDNQLVEGFSGSIVRFKLGFNGSTGQAISTRDGQFAVGLIDTDQLAAIRFLTLGTGASYIDAYSEGTSKAANYPLFIGSRTNNASTLVAGSTTEENGTRVVFGSAVSDASALVQINSTTRGFLPPRMTTTQKNAIATPAAGLVVYDSTTNKLCCYNGSTWNDLF